MDKIFSDRTRDPLLFLSNDKSDLDNFLLTGGDMDHINDDLQVHINDNNSLDFDSLEGNGQLGDMNWLHNSSLSALTHIDNEDTSDGTTMISVNPQSVLPMQIIEPSKPDNLLSSENANSAAMRLHANCSNLIGSDSPEERKPTNNSSTMMNPEHSSIRILSVAGAFDAVNSPSKPANFIITSTRGDSPLKSQTFVLNTANGVLTPGDSISTVSQRSGSVRAQNTANLVLASPQKLHALGADKNGRVLLKTGLSPSQASPVLLGHLQTGVGVQQQVFQTAQVVSTNGITSTQCSDTGTVSSTTNYGEDKAYPKPVFSYSCLIALALKNSKNGSLPVSEIYNFMCENFPYFKTAPDGWKNSVRHNLSLNKCFAKVDNPKMSQGAKKGCLWALNPAKVTKMEEEISKWGKKDPVGLLNSMAYPENLDAIEKGQAGLHYSKKTSPEPVVSTPVKAEATPTKVEYSPAVSHEFRPIKVEHSHTTATHIPVESIPQYVTPVKVRVDHHHHHHHQQQQPQHQHHPSTPVRQTYSPVVHSPIVHSPVVHSPVVHSPVVHRCHTSSPMRIPTAMGSSPARTYAVSPVIDMDVYNSPMKASSTADPSTKALSINDIHSTINTDALTDIVLQNGIWESEDLENEINIDLICDSPTAQFFLPVHSPVPNSASPNTVHSSSLNSGYCSPSIQASFPNVVQSPIPQGSPTPNSVRNNLFGVTTPTRKPLYI